MFDYEGEEFDSTTNDYDFDARRYNPFLKTFIQPDSLIQDVYDPQTLNHYAFERNNPYGNTDEDGHNPVLIIGGAALIAAGLEIGIQVTYAGDVYSWQRVAESAAGAAALAAFVMNIETAAALPKWAEGTVAIADLIATTLDVESSIEEAKEHEGYAEQFAMDFELQFDPNINNNFVSIEGYSNPFNLQQDPEGRTSSFSVSSNEGSSMQFQGSEAVQEKFKEAGLTVSSSGGN